MYFHTEMMVLHL